MPRPRLPRRPRGLKLEWRGGIIRIVGSYQGRRIRESTSETNLEKAQIKLAIKIEELFEEEIRRRRCKVYLAEQRKTVWPPPAPAITVEPVAKIQRTVEEAILLYVGKHKDADRPGIRPLKLKKLSQRAIKDAERILVAVRELDCERGISTLCNDSMEELLEALAGKITGKDAESSTVKRAVLNPLRAALIRANLRWSDKQGCPRPHFPAIQEGKCRTIAIPVYVAEKMIALAEEFDGWLASLVLQLGLCEGPRISEIYNLEWEDIHFEGRSLTFYDTKERTLVTEHRIVNDLRPRTLDALLTYRDRTGIESGKVCRNLDGMPYCDETGLVKAVNKWLRALAEEVGFKLHRECTSHALRHSATSWHRLVDGIDVVQDRMGWKDYRSVRRYCHPVPSTTKADVLRFWRWHNFDTGKE